MTEAPQHWIIVTSPENFEIDREGDFSVAGCKERFKRLLEKVQVGDKLTYYIMRRRQFGAICTVVSPVYIDRTPRWSEADEVWACRLKVNPDLVLPREKMLDVRDILPSLSFIHERQRRVGWGVVFRQCLRRIPLEDFKLIRQAMERKLAELEDQPEHGRLPPAYHD